MAEAEPALTVETASGPEECLFKARKLAEGHDFIVADGPGGLNDVSRTLLLLADLAVVPITPSILDLTSAREATEVLRYAQTINQGRPQARVVLNRFRLRETISGELRRALERFDIPGCQSVIRDLQVFRDAAQQGIVVTRMALKATSVAEELDSLFTELLEVARGAHPLPQIPPVHTTRDIETKDSL